MAAIASLNANRLTDPENLYIPGFKGIMKKKIYLKKKIKSPGGGHFDYRRKAENLIR